MGSAKKMFAKLAGMKVEGKALVEKVKEKPVQAEQEQRVDAAKRRARRAGRRGLMSPDRLGGGDQEEGTKTTLGA